MEPLEQREQIFIQYKKWLYYLGNPRPIFLCLCVGCVILSIRSTHLSPRPSFSVPFNPPSGHNRKASCISVVKSTFQTLQISDAKSSPSVMTPRLLDISDAGKPWSWSLATTGGLRCPGILASMCLPVICACGRKQSVNHLWANSIHYQFRTNLGMWSVLISYH